MLPSPTEALKYFRPISPSNQNLPEDLRWQILS